MSGRGSIALGAVLAGLLVVLPFAPVSSQAQQTGKVARVGLLFPSTTTPWVKPMQIFRERLLELGWTEGKNLVLDVRYADNKADQLSALAAELVALKPDVIFAAGSRATRVVVQATTTIPIVFETLGDAVGSGLVPNLTRPGGNVTGVSGFSPGLAEKQLQLVREIVPQAARVAVLSNDDGPGTPSIVRALETAARQLGIQLHVVDVRRADQLDSAFQRISQRDAEALLVLSDTTFTSELRRIVGLATRHRLPSAFEIQDFAHGGGLLSYGPTKSERWQQAAGQIDRILRGAKAGDLPIQQPTEFALVVNLKTAKALNLTIPHSVLLRTDQLIE